MRRLGQYAIIFAMQNSRYNLVHALLVSGILLIAACSNGVGAFWHQFIYGLDKTLSPQALSLSFLIQTGFFGALIAGCWASTAALVNRQDSCESAPVTAASNPNRSRAIVFALKIAVPVILVALGLNAVGAKVVEWVFNVTDSQQELIKCFADPSFTLKHHVLMAGSVLLVAPVLEEVLFRGIVFRGFAKKLPLPLAMAVSGFVFALVHVNAASFLALWYLGVSFAWLYARTRTILAPITLHCAFNLANLLLLYLFPGLAT